MRFLGTGATEQGANEHTNWPAMIYNLGGGAPDDVLESDSIVKVPLRVIHSPPLPRATSGGEERVRVLHYSLLVSIL